MSLPRGRHRLSAGEVEADQRLRMLATVGEVLAERGYARATVGDILKRSGVSRRTFYEQFEGKDDCLYAAYADAERRLWTKAATAAGPEMAARHSAALDRLAATLRTGNGRGGMAASGIDLPESTERTLVGNVAALVGSYVLSGATELLPGLEPQLAEHLLAPYREAVG